MKNKGTLKSNIFAIIAGILILIGMVGFLSWLIQRVIEGKGTDLYQSVWGISFSAIGLLITIFVVVMAVLLGSYINHKHKKEEKDFISKYGKKSDVQ